MYKQLYLGAKVASFCLTPKKKSKKEIAHIVDISQSTLSRELKRNGSPSGKYVWFKDMTRPWSVESVPPPMLRLPLSWYGE